MPRAESVFSGFEPRALGSIAVLLALVSGIGYGAWTVLQEVQRVTLAPVDQAPGVVAELDPLASAGTQVQSQSEASDQAVAALPSEDQQPDAGALDRLYRPQALDVPVPRNSERHGVPSACGVCHKDRTPAQLDAALLARWPQARKRQARRLRLADAIDEATAAGSRPALLSVLADRGEAPSLRATCAILLAQRFPRGATSVLVPLLADPDALVRWRAVEALGQAQAREAAAAIAGTLRDPSLPVRVAAAVTLISLGDARGEAAVRELTTARDTAALMLPHYALAQLHFRRGELEGAARSLERAVERMPYFVDGLVGLGEIYRRMGRTALARARFDEALFFDPASRDIRQRLEQLDRPGPPR